MARSSKPLSSTVRSGVQSALWVLAAGSLVLASCYSGYNTGPGGSSASSCESDDDCGSGKVCSSGYCVQESSLLFDTGPSDGGDGGDVTDGLAGCTDEDGDGYYAEEGCGDQVDCDDSNADVHPGATEFCNGTDNDCDGEVDEEAADAETVYADADDDGWGVEDDTTSYCPETQELPEGYAERSGDCAPEDPMKNPAARELCNGEDDDCNGEVDDGVETVTWYPDEDDDGYGTEDEEAETRENCAEPSEGDWAQRRGDCNDQNADANPMGTEVCDGEVDEDCDGEVDENCDDDGDGYCDPDMTVVGAADQRSVCPNTPEGDGNDCNDEVRSINPGVRDDEGPTESGEFSKLCNGLDDDCDGQVDEGCPTCAFDPTSASGNSTGTQGTGVCATGTLQVADGDAGTVCTAPSTFEAGSEATCDGLDNDCDGDVDEEFSLGETCTVGEGVCQSTGQIVCADDGSTTCSASPGSPSTEVCDGKDNDCDGSVDEEFPTLGDSCSVGTGVCQSDGTVVCTDDGSGTTCGGEAGSPSTEVCDGKDNDCDGNVDEEFPALGDSCSVGEGVCQSDGSVVCTDDGSGTTCGAEAGSSSSEVCDGKDNDCDGNVDEEFGTLGDSCTVGTGVCKSDGSVVCADDGSSTTCGAEPGSSSSEVCDGKDNDCDGNVDEEFPTLGNSCTVGTGVCESDGTVVCTDDGSGTTCGGEPGSGSTEACDGKDNDCDGTVDEGFSVGDSCTVGQGACENSGTLVCNDSEDGTVCTAEAGTPDSETCNDTDDDCDGNVDENLTRECGDSTGVCTEGTESCSSGSWGSCTGNTESSAEICDGLDNDCDGSVDEGCDNDADGYCDSSMGCESGATCSCQGGSNGNGGDCVDDPNSDGFYINPGAAPLDSNFSTDNCLEDVDRDGYGDEVAPTNGSQGNDCDDGDPQQNPGETEVCNGKDDNCDGNTDKDQNGNVLTAPCNNQTGVCAGSTKECTNGDFSQSCDGTNFGGNYTTDDAETGYCDGLDNDCDGSTDDGYSSLGSTCTVGLGACENSGNIVCNSSGDGVTCDASPGTPSQETCGNNTDDDCDGVIDEGCPCDYNGDSTGVCSNGVSYDGDDDGIADECNPPSNYQSDETICDSADNDCDGTVDEGCDDDGDGYCDESKTYKESANCLPGDCADADNPNNEYINPGAAPLDANHDGSNCLKDVDRDGYGDADNSSFGGTAGEDCEDDTSDDSPYIYPGAASNDDPNACMKDVDGDEWGDSGFSNANGGTVGTDCVDNFTGVSSYIFPGAAENDSTFADAGSACAKDVDEDGWGDDAGGSYSAGGDCNDSKGSVNEGASEACDGLDNDCDGDVDEALSANVTPGTDCTYDCGCRPNSQCIDGDSDSQGECSHRIFVTSDANKTDGNFTLDSKCNNIAGAEGLDGTWTEVVSTSSTDASSRINQNTGAAVVNFGGDVLDSDDNLWNDGIDAPVLYDSSGSAVSSDYRVWTATSSDGTKSGGTYCGNNWSSNAGGDNGDYGNAGQKDSNWVQTGNNEACNTQLRLYCIDGQ